jgi:hypothetical protein
LQSQKYYCEGGLAQLARAFDWQSKGRQFDSDILHQNLPPKAVPDFNSGNSLFLINLLNHALFK